MEKQPETIVEEREEYMVSPTGDGKNSTFRTAHFLKPSVTSIDKPIFEFPTHFLSCLPTTSEPSKWPLKVTFKGWRCPLRHWKTWVDHLNSKYQSTWKKVGIYEAIMASKFEIRRYNDLVLGIAEKWCSETNTFIFPWGEATVTLEDVMILGGYPVLGDSISASLETDGIQSIEQNLNKVRQQIIKSKANKAEQRVWIKYFMENDSEFEHEAFLSLWLSRFVLPLTYDTISRHVFPIAIHLGRGKRIALAPAVLASTYRDLSLLNEKIVASSKLEDKYESFSLTLWSPFQIVQIWVWERFEKLRPNPNLIEYNEPRVARWHRPNRLRRVENMRWALDSAGECFEWRPYAKNVDNWLFPKFYREKEEWVLIDSDLDIEIESYARCLKVCELVGFDCIEQYLPHRVAMQFGMDQDIPGHVARCNETPEIAWKTYRKKPISETKLFLPSRHFEPDVTTCYSKWWRQSVLGQQGLMKGDFGQQTSSEKTQQCSKKRKQNNDAAVPQGFPLKCNTVHAMDSSKDDDLTVAEMLGLKRLQDSNVKGDHDAMKRLQDSNEKGDHAVLSPSSTSDNEGVEKMESLMERGKKIMCSEAATGGSGRVGDNAHESRPPCAANNSEVGSIGYDTFEVPGLELESRISSLEKQFAGLKEKYGYNFGISSTKGGPSHL